MRRTALWCAVVLCGLSWPSTLSAQQTPGSEAGGSSGAASPGQEVGGGAAGVPGGAAMADFDTLINLIQTTIEPDSWLIAGGQSTITQYPAGVYVDPKGHMKRIVEDVEVPELRLSTQEWKENQWLEPNPLRVISLKELDKALLHAAQFRQAPTLELTRLAGLSSIMYVRIDIEHEDILLAGPSGEPALGFHLEDVVTVAGLMNANTAAIGCSIDPSDAGIRSVQQLLSQPDSLKRLARSPNTFAKQMHASVGPQNVSIFGINPRSSTAIALVDADEHMKKVGFGIAKLSRKIPTYFDHLSDLGTIPKESLVRWWFAFGDEPVRVSATGETYQLPSQLVQVMSEKQWMSATGRQASGERDVAADRFAEDFTKRIVELRKTHPAYARLCAVFELSLSLQLALEHTGQPDLRAWMPTLCALGRAEVDSIQEPKTVEGLATAKRLASGTVVAVVSGGVKVDARKLVGADKIVQSKFLASSAVPPQQQNELSAGRWWWSGE